MMRRVCILDNQDSFSHNVRLLFSYCGDVDVVVIPTVEYEKTLFQTMDTIVFSPGPGIPDDFPQMKLALQEAPEDFPILGICLGHQAIVEYYGGSLYAMRQVRHGIQSKVTVIDKEDALWQGISNPIVGRYHSFLAHKKSFPKTLQITAVEERGRIMSFRHKDRPVFGVQFHPESYMTNCGARLIKNYLQLI